MWIKNLFKKKEDMAKSWIYYGIFFSEDTKEKILEYVKNWFKENDREFPKDWKVYCDHMTLVFNTGSLSDQAFAKKYDNKLGQTETLKAKYVGISDRAIALGIDFKTNNEHSHVTVAITPDGGKPVESNYIKNWYEVDDNFTITGTYKKIC